MTDNKRPIVLKGEIPHTKCSRCQCWRPNNNFLSKTGRRLKTCQKCRYKCPHGRQSKTRCNECGGSAMCEHKTQRRTCKYCKIKNPNYTGDAKILRIKQHSQYLY